MIVIFTWTVNADAFVQALDITINIPIWALLSNGAGIKQNAVDGVFPEVSMLEASLTGIYHGHVGLVACFNRLVVVERATRLDDR